MSNPRSSPRRREYWHGANVIFPRKTIYGQWVQGRCYKRDVSSVGGLLEGTVWRKEYATKKELFMHNLKVGA